MNDIDHLYAVPILNDEEEYVISSPETVADGTYNPLSRLIYMNLWNDAKSLDNTRPFLQFAFSTNGTSLVQDTGLVAIDESERELLLSSLPAKGESFAIEVEATEKASKGSPTALSTKSQETSDSSPSWMKPANAFHAVMLMTLTLLPYAAFVH